MYGAVINVKYIVYSFLSKEHPKDNQQGTTLRLIFVVLWPKVTKKIGLHL